MLTWPPTAETLRNLKRSKKLSDAAIADSYGVSVDEVRELRRQLGVVHVRHRSSVQSARDLAAKNMITKAKRTCLKCGRIFVSDGPGNRICACCKKSNSSYALPDGYAGALAA